jgi:hypothetical protein
MKASVVKTTFVDEQKRKDDFFLSLSPLERWAVSLQVRERMRRKNQKYSYEGMKVTITRLP